MGMTVCIACRKKIEAPFIYFCTECEYTLTESQKKRLIDSFESDCRGPRKPKVLLVDDEPHVLEVLKKRFEFNQYEVLTAIDGEEGYAKIKAEKPDLIVLDILMPGMTGYEVLKKLRAGNDGTEKIPVIVITAKGAMRNFFPFSKRDAFMVKPFQPEALLEKAAELLAAQSGSPDQSGE